MSIREETQKQADTHKYTGRERELVHGLSKTQKKLSHLLAL